MRPAPVVLGDRRRLPAACLHLLKTEGGWSSFLLGLVAFSLSPYALAAAVAWWFRPAALLPALGFAAAALAGDLYMHYAVFIAPMGSTAALGLLIMPCGTRCCWAPLARWWGGDIARLIRHKPARRHLV